MTALLRPINYYSVKPRQCIIAYLMIFFSVIIAQGTIILAAIAFIIFARIFLEISRTTNLQDYLQEHCQKFHWGFLYDLSKTFWIVYWKKFLAGFLRMILARIHLKCPLQNALLFTYFFEHFFRDCLRNAPRNSPWHFLRSFSRNLSKHSSWTDPRMSSDFLSEIFFLRFLKVFYRKFWMNSLRKLFSMSFSLGCLPNLFLRISQEILPGKSPGSSPGSLLNVSSKDSLLGAFHFQRF